MYVCTFIRICYVHTHTYMYIRLCTSIRNAHTQHIHAYTLTFIYNHKFTIISLNIRFSRLYYSWACIESLDVLLMCQFTDLLSLSVLKFSNYTFHIHYVVD